MSLYLQGAALQQRVHGPVQRRRRQRDRAQTLNPKTNT